jgi:transcription elongation GreA/GreB family factor
MVKEKTEKIEIEKSKLDEIMQRMERLEKAASKARLHTIDSKNKENENFGKTVNLRMMERLLLVGAIWLKT